MMIRKRCKDGREWKESLSFCSAGKLPLFVTVTLASDAYNESRLRCKPFFFFPFLFVPSIIVVCLELGKLTENECVSTSRNKMQ